MTVHWAYQVSPVEIALDLGSTYTPEVQRLCATLEQHRILTSYLFGHGVSIRFYRQGLTRRQTVVQSLAISNFPFFSRNAY